MAVILRYYTESGILEANYIEVVEDIPLGLQRKYSPKNLFSLMYDLWL